MLQKVTLTNSSSSAYLWEEGRPVILYSQHMLYTVFQLIEEYCLVPLLNKYRLEQKYEERTPSVNASGLHSNDSHIF